MTRRELCLLATVGLGTTVATGNEEATGAAFKERRFFVSPNGNDANSGTLIKPFRTIRRAQAAVRQVRRHTAQPVRVLLRGGTYYLEQPLVFTSADSGDAKAPLIYEAYRGEHPVLSGGTQLVLTWKPYKNGIWQAIIPSGVTTDQLFVNGKQQILARYPNYDPDAGYFDGWSPDAWGPERAATWKDPRGAFLHAMHKDLWGDFHYIVTGKDATGQLVYEGGWQNNRRSGIHDRFRFVENVFEELDAPGEWFLDEQSHVLYFYPPAGLNLAAAKIEVVRLRHLVEYRGTPDAPVRHIHLRQLAFQHTRRTFMDNREPLLRSDWTIYRGGAVLFTGAEDCVLTDCTLTRLGGNAVFLSGYNRRLIVQGCHITEVGASGVCAVGEAKAVRGALFEYEERQDFATVDKTPGPKTTDYPMDCRIEDCLIHRTGRVEKQTAPVQLAMALHITIRHCSLYDVPRAGINIGDGCWGGHVIEFCDVFDTVKETGDHGSFNSWGRDRWWGLKGIDPNTIGTENPQLPLLDTIAPITLRYNRWRCDHGWDIDLDDGASNYHIHDNLCLNGGIKNREGFYRVVRNNVLVNNTFHPHVWYRDSGDVFQRNIVFTPYKPIAVPKPWGRTVDNNFLQISSANSRVKPASILAEESGRDAHSLEGDARFIDAKRGDFRVQTDSPALRTGFVNFAMNRFGVQRPALRMLARTPVLPSVTGNADTVHPSTGLFEWMGATVKTLTGLSEASVVGVGEESGGVLVVAVPSGSAAARAGLYPLDLITGVSDKPVKTVADLQRLLQDAPILGEIVFAVRRAQQNKKLAIRAPLPALVPKL